MPITTSFEIHTLWTPGPARYENGDIVMPKPPKSERRNTLGGSTPAGADVELARIHEPDDAVAFVNKFGLLESQWPDEGAELREPFALFADTAADLREVLWVMKSVREAAKELKGANSRHARKRATVSSQTLEELREWASRAWAAKGAPTTLHDFIAGIDADGFLIAVTQHIAERLSRRMLVSTSLEAVGPSVPRDPREAVDRLSPIIHAHHIRAYCYAQTFIKLMSRAPILTCPKCAHDFVREGNRFCSRNCARRARYKASKKPTLPPETRVAVGA